MRTGSGTRHVGIGFAVVLAVLLAAIPAVTFAAKTTAWTGGSNALWSIAGNWTNGIPATGDTLVWAATSTANKVSVNDLVGLSIAKIDYQNAPDGIVLTGYGLTIGTPPLAGPAGTSPNITINLDLALPETTVFQDNTGYACAVLNGVLSGAWTSLTINRTSATGLYALNGLNTFSGPVVLAAGNGIGNYIINTLKDSGGANPQSLGTGNFVQFGGVNNSDRGNLYYTGGATSTDKGFQIGGPSGASIAASGGVFANGTGALTWTGVQTLAPTLTARTFTLGGFNNDANTWESAIGNNNTGKVALVKAGRGTWVLKGANSFTNGVTVNSGTLTLDYVNTPTVVSSTNTLDLGGGTLELRGASSGGSAQTIGTVATTLTTGPSTIRINQNGGTGTALTTAGLTRYANSSLLFDFIGSPGSSATVGTSLSTPNAGILIRDSTGRVDYVTNAGANTTISALMAATDLIAGANTATDYRLTGSQTLTAAGPRVRTLRIAPSIGGQSLTLSPSTSTANFQILTGGGILFAGDYDFTINQTGTGCIADGTGVANDAVIHHYGTGKLTLAVKLAGSSTSSGDTGALVGLLGTGLIDWTTRCNGGGEIVLGGVTVRNSGTGGALLDTTATGAGSGNLVLTGGAVLELTDTNCTRNVGTVAGATQWKGDGGFSAYGANRAVNLAGGAQQTWGTPFVPSDNALLLGSAYANSTIDFQNPIDLGGLQRVVLVTNGSAAVDARLSGVLSGGLTGGLVKEGNGTLELTAANSYAGETWVNAGTLRLGSNGTVGALSPGSAIRVSSGAVFAVNRSDSVTQGVHFGTAAITGAGGFTQAGSGTTVLTAANSYTGPTTVSAGTLRINGNLSGAAGAVSVAGGTLGGTGTVGGAVTVANSATALLYPNSAFAGGTLTCASNVTFAGSSAVAKFDLSATTGSGNDKVVLANNATLTCGGATVTINSAGTLELADYTLFDVGAGGTISGSFAATPVWTGTAPANSNQYSIALDGTTKKVLLKYAASTVPGVSPDAATTFTNMPVTIQVTTNDTDFTPPIASVVGALLWPGSTAVIQNNTNILYTPATGSNGVDQFQYVLTNAAGSATGTVTVTVNIPPPSGGSDTAITTVNTPVTISVTANDANFDPPIASVLGGQLWPGSTAVVQDSTNILYTPATGSNGVDQFQYVLTNAAGSATGTVAVTVVLPVVASNDTAATFAGSPVTIRVTTNDSNFTPPIASVLVGLLWPGSTAVIQNSTNILYTPASGSNGMDQFQYVITNAYGHSATGLVSVTVAILLPTASNDTARTTLGSSVTIPVTTNDVNFLPPIGSVLSTLLWPGSTAVVQNDTNILYTPAAGSNGVDQFQYVITNAVGSATGTVTVTVAAPGTAYWHAQGTTANWSDAGNWDDDNTKDADTYTPVSGVSMVWNANSTAYLSNTNDLVGLSVNGMDFNAAPGPVTIAGNALALGASTTTIKATNNPVALNLPLVIGANNGTLVVQGTGLTINGAISESTGACGVGVDGAGYAVTLNGLNTFSGPTRINEGTVTISTLGLAANAQPLGTNGTIRLGYRTTNVDIGNLVYTGPATTSNWKLQLGDFNNYPNVGGGFYNNGSGAVTWTGTLVTASAGTTGTRSLTLGGSNADNNDWQAVIGNMSSAAEVALTKAGAGKWVLAGNNTYSGPTTISNGTLLVNGNQSGATGAVTVAGGTLGGTGTVGGAVSVAAGASLAPGNAGVGTLTVTNAVLLAEGAVYKWEYQNGAGDLVVLKGANGTLTLPSVATVEVSQVSGSLPSPAILFTATAIDGATDLSGWTVTGLQDGFARRAGFSVILMSYRGTTFMMR